MPKLAKWVRLLLPALACLGIGAGCSPKMSVKAFLKVPDISQRPPGVAPTPVPTGAYNLSNAPKFPIHKETDIKAPCEAAKGERVHCIVEGMELDLYAQGATLTYDLPAGMCDYLRKSSYWYAVYPSGEGPLEITEYTDQNGDIGATYDPATNLVNSAKPTCSYDYTDIEGPNCCIGNYTKHAVAWDGAAWGAPVDTERNKWGGDFSKCLGGDAVKTMQKTVEGIPRSLVTATNGKKLTGNHTVAAPIVTLGSFSNTLLHSNISIANFTSGTTPVPISSPLTPVSASSPYSGPFTSADGKSEYYRFECLDSAYDAISEIYISIREWNNVENFKKMESGVLPDATGVEGGPWDAATVNDRMDWKDFTDNASRFPGGYPLSYE